MVRSKVLDLTKESADRLKLMGIYFIKSKVNDKYYVGSTTETFITRWRNHYYLLNNGKHHAKYLQRHTNKHGINMLEFGIIEIIKNKNLCRKREKYWIDVLDSYHNGFNSSEETDIRIGGKTHPLYLNIEEDKLVDLYCNKKITAKNIAKIFNTSSFKILRELKRLGVDLNNHLNVLPIKEIYYRHNLGGEELKDLAKEYNTVDSTIRRQFKKFGFKHRMEILDERMPEIKEYYNKGGDIVKYCEKTPFSHDSVYRRLKK